MSRNSTDKNKTLKEHSSHNNNNISLNKKQSRTTKKTTKTTNKKLSQITNSNKKKTLERVVSLQKLQTSGFGTNQDYQNILFLAKEIQENNKSFDNKNIIKSICKKERLTKKKIKTIVNNSNKKLIKTKKTENFQQKQNSVREKVTKKENNNSRYLESNYLYYFLGKGNNEALIKKIMDKRQWWKKTDQLSTF